MEQNQKTAVKLVKYFHQLMKSMQIVENAPAKIGNPRGHVELEQPEAQQQTLASARF
jgi:hypothetical protein